MAAASSAPAPRTVRRFSGLSAEAAGGGLGVVAAGEEVAEPDGSAGADGVAAEADVLALGSGVADAAADGED